LPILFIMKDDDDFRIGLVESVFVAADIRKSMYFEESGKKLKM
jgi:hypothetical protein